ncbi:MAG: DUF952 domain-containing protein [Janthinobacterium lividum]
MTGTLLHVTTADAWAAGPPVPPVDGFLHLCTPAQLPFVLERHFAGQSGLVVLHLDAALLADVRWEVSEPGMDPFPHLYGPLPGAAVREVEPLPSRRATPLPPAAG